MKSLVYAISGAVAVMALAVATPVLGQGGQGGGGGAHSGGGGMGGAGGGGNNGPAGSGGNSAASGGNVGGGMSSGGGFSGGSSSGDGGGFSGGSGGGSTSGGFSGGGSSFSGASPMGGTHPMGGERVGRPGGGAALRSGAVRNEMSAEPGNRSVPGGSRPNYGNPSVGSAIPRNSYTPPTGGGYGQTSPNSSDWWNGYYGGYYYPGYYYGMSGWGGYYGGGYYGGYGSSRYYYYPYDPFYLYGYGAFGLGSLYYDPLWWGSMSPGFGMGGYSGGGGGWSGASSSSGSNTPSGPKGGLKLKVTPKDAEVYVDGYYIGRVDDYNGAFQRLDLPVGLHRIELRAKGYAPVSFETKIQARDTISYQGAMQLQPVK
jgi:hypothetical protein